MSENRSRLLLTGALVGAVLGSVAAWIAADAQEEQAKALEPGESELKFQPGAKDWITFSVAAVALLRQFSDMLYPKNKR